MSVERGPQADRLVGPILLTGAAGAVGTALRGPLAGLAPLHLADLREPPDGPGESVVVGDLADPAVAERAVAGVSAIVHLAGHPRPDAAWDVLVDANLRTTAALLDAAARQRVRRVVLASSVHVAGGYGDPREWPVDPHSPARPCCRYGISKATSELLVQGYAEADPDVAAVALRFGLVAPAPRWTEEVRGWTPESDLGLLVTRALRVRPGYQVHFAVTATEGPRYRTEGIREALGYRSAARDHLTGQLSDEPPEYAEECRLWRHPALLARWRATKSHT